MSGALARRLVQLYAGLVLYGVSIALLLLAGLGNMPWDVLHEGLARRTSLSTGTWVVLVGVAVLLLWIPLRIRPGLGTISNVLVLGPVADLVLVLADPPRTMVARVGMLVFGVGLNGVATSMYIAAGFGPGPRDGLMTGLAARGLSIRLVRTSLEVTVVVLGALLGGTIGVGTVLYALGIGPLVHWLLPFFDGPDDDAARSDSPGHGTDVTTP